MLASHLIVLLALTQAAGVESVADRYRALSREYEAKRGAFLGAYFATEDEARRREIVGRLAPNRADYAGRFLALAREEPAGPAASDALYEVLQLQGGRLSEDGREAMDRLRRDFVASPKMGEYLQQLSMHGAWTEVEPLLREVLARNPDRTARGQACLGLALVLGDYADLPKLVNDPTMATKMAEAFGDDHLKRVLARDHAGLLAEATELYERVLREFADVRYFPAHPQDTKTLAFQAEAWLGRERELAIGKPAPEIEGRDVDGRPLKLSDFRGKVVALVFSASWCGPCMDQVQHERQLVAKLAGRPFALLGVNCDYNAAAARKMIASEGITWPNWYDGDPAARHNGDGPIRERYHIQGIPAVFVLDERGVIVEKDVRGLALERAIEAALRGR